MRFVVVGDAGLDVTVAPSRPLRDGGDVPATIRLGPGGQGANVAVRLARRGADVRLVAPIGEDTAGRLLRETLVADGVAVEAQPASRSASVVALLDPGGERSMLSDRRSLNPGGIPAALAGASWVHCSGYPLLDDATGDALARALGDRGAGVRLSVAGGSVPPEPA
ncbi:MAG: carbohydrate kinase family protein, partial [Candidatus Limnocylindria bacterium]